MGIYDQLEDLNKRPTPPPASGRPQLESGSPATKTAPPTAKPAKPSRDEVPPRLTASPQPVSVQHDPSDSQTVNKSVYKERNPDIKKERFLEFLKPFLDMRSAGMVSFRYPQDLMELMAEVQYQVQKRYRVKLTKNAMLVAALSFLLWDFEQKGEDSILYSHLINGH